MGSFDYITQVLDRAVEDAQPIEVKGRVIQVVGTIIKAAVPGVKVGEVCILRNPWEDFEVLAEVVGFTKEAVLLTSLGQMIGISAQTEVIPTRRIHMVPVGYSLLGRVLTELTKCSLPVEFSIGHTVKDPEAVKTELLAKAVEDSRKKAEVLAAAAGLKLGRIVTIDYSWDELEIYAQPMKRMAASGAGAMLEEDCCDIDIEADDINV